MVLLILAVVFPLALIGLWWKSSLLRSWWSRRRASLAWIVAAGVSFSAVAAVLTAMIGEASAAFSAPPALYDLGQIVLGGGALLLALEINCRTDSPKGS